MAVRKSREIQRDLLIGMAYHRGSTLVAQRSYTYDTLGRPLTRSTARNGQTVNDSFVHNSRSELTSATVSGAAYGYDYDNIGNRRMAMEASNYTIYEVNNLNQYTSIQENEDTSFVSTFDADGSTVVECTYNHLGRQVHLNATRLFQNRLNVNANG
ncbi:MAG: hypothetical protein E7032_08860 [Akkermansiaceae bacterium]|nr:hypothetical protein [Akkermansiaceae bacterium]